jgi:hypothetical protein
MHRNHPHPMTPRPGSLRNRHAGARPRHTAGHFTQHISRASEHIARSQDIVQLPQGEPPIIRSVAATRRAQRRTRT